MRTMEVRMVVRKKGEANLEVPLDIAPGEYQAVVVMEEETIQERPPLRFSAYPAGLVSERITFSRRELYDDGR